MFQVALVLGESTMYRSAARLVAAVVVAAAGIYLGLRLALYAEADDAPGGVVIGVLIMFGSLALGSWIALRRGASPPAPGGAKGPPG